MVTLVTTQVIGGAEPAARGGVISWVTVTWSVVTQPFWVLVTVME